MRLFAGPAEDLFDMDDSEISELFDSLEFTFGGGSKNKQDFINVTSNCYSRYKSNVRYL